MSHQSGRLMCDILLNTKQLLSTTFLTLLDLGTLLYINWNKFKLSIVDLCTLLISQSIL